MASDFVGQDLSDHRGKDHQPLGLFTGLLSRSPMASYSPLAGQPDRMRGPERGGRCFPSPSRDDRPAFTASSRAVQLQGKPTPRQPRNSQNGEAMVSQMAPGLK